MEGVVVILNEGYSIPDRFVQELHEYDSDLRYRWGRAEGLVRVERRVRRERLDYVPPISDDPRMFDDYEMIREGYVLVLKFPPLESAWPLVVFTLAQTDLQRLGGARQLADDLEAQEQYEKARRQWNRRDDFRAMGREMYRDLNTIRTSPEGAGWRKNASFK